MRVLSYMLMALVLAACQPVVDRATHIAEETKDSFWLAVDSLEEALQYEPEPDPQQPPERYCYRAHGDVVCYEEPREASTIGAFEGSQGTEKPLIYQSVPAETIQVKETAKVIVAPKTVEPAFDPDAPEPLVGF